MHTIQTQLLALSKSTDLGALSLRQIAKMLNVEGKPQTIKHHLLQLEKAGLLQLDMDEGVIKPIKRGFNASNSQKSPLYSLPIVGTANCGPQTVFADERIEGYLKVSNKFLPRKKSDLYVLIADGPSMNKAEVRKGVTIEDGDFVVVDQNFNDPKGGEIIVAVIDNLATIKRYHKDKEHDRIVLEAESTEKYHPIFVHEGDDFQISGKVVDVIKNSNRK